MLVKVVDLFDELKVVLLSFAEQLVVVLLFLVELQLEVLYFGAEVGFVGVIGVEGEVLAISGEFFPDLGEFAVMPEGGLLDLLHL